MLARVLTLLVLGSSTAFRAASSLRASAAHAPRSRSAAQLCATPDAAVPDSKRNETSAGAAVGLAGLAASGATVSAITTAAGGVCVGGGCVAGAGLAAGAAGAGGAAAGAGAAGGAAAAAFGGLQTWLAGGLVAAGLGTQLLTGDVPPEEPGALPPAMAAMVRSSTPLSEIRSPGNGRPTVLEFYRPACPRCNRLAPSLQAVEARAQKDGVNWVMLNTDEPSSVPVFTKYGVSELCARRRERACACAQPSPVRRARARLTDSALCDADAGRTLPSSTRKGRTSGRTRGG